MELRLTLVFGNADLKEQMSKLDEKIAKLTQVNEALSRALDMLLEKHQEVASDQNLQALDALIAEGDSNNARIAATLNLPQPVPPTP